MCSVQFDRKDIAMNKLLVTGLESKVRVYDLRTQHPQSGFASVSEKVRRRNPADRSTTAPQSGAVRTCRRTVTCS